MNGLRLYFGFGISDDSKRIAKKVIPGKIKYKGNTTAHIGFKAIEGDSLDEICSKLHEQVDLFFYEVNKRLEFNANKVIAQRELENMECEKRNGSK